ncbi:kinase-like domain-containing protein [Rhizophagus clarus]|uniref:Kinase-like domain-containing protein n=1 Tax=Rhizophagus clarus TaxID=94130 RepID=A0A8H3L593_9GLOM|nr:kinase-like domain-containing protein [Rhizophagus clarus]
MDYANGGSLYDYLQRYFTSITWKGKLRILPSIAEFQNTVHKWNYNVEFTRIFEQSEDKRIELVQSKKFCPKFNERKHPKAIFTSRELSSLISKASIYKPSTNKFSTISFNNGEYISKEYEYDINSIQRYLPY